MKKVLAVVLSLVLCLSLCLCAFAEKNDKVITVAASPTPHAEILAVAAEVLEKEGWKLEITEYNDYVVPNNVVEDGEIDANYFQHTPYLDEFNEANGTHLVSVATVHYEPLGLYPGTKTSLADLSDGDKVAVANDTTNRARGLQLLEAQGLIKLKEGVGLTATKLDIVENPLNLQIEELEAAQIPNFLDDVAVAVINGNYALGAGLNAGTDALAVEASDSLAATTFGNILVVKEGNENTEKTLALKKALLSDEVRDFINSNYSGAVVPMF